MTQGPTGLRLTACTVVALDRGMQNIANILIELCDTTLSLYIIIVRVSWIRCINALRECKMARLYSVNLVPLHTLVCVTRLAKHLNTYQVF